MIGEVRGEHAAPVVIAALAGIALAAATGAAAIATALGRGPEVPSGIARAVLPVTASAAAVSPSVASAAGERPALPKRTATAGASSPPGAKGSSGAGEPAALPERTPAAGASSPPGSTGTPAVSPAGCHLIVALRFPYGAAIAPPDAAAALAPIVAYLADHPRADAVVDGHADPTGDDTGNLVLSRRRADRVTEVLARAGVARSRIVERAFGAYVPLVGENPAALRRVRVSLHDPSCVQEDRP